MSTNQSQVFYSVPPERSFNNGTLSTIDQWIFENIKIPPTPKGSQFSFQTLFDLKNGGFGVDNIHFQTQQKYVIVMDLPKSIP